MPGHELDHTSFSDVPLDPAFKAENYTSPTMVYNEKGEMIDEDSQALITELDLFLRQFQKRRTDADSYVAKVTSSARRWITDVRDKTRPFMLWVDSFDPHEPWDPPSVWANEPCPYDPDYKGNPLVLTPWNQALAHGLGSHDDRRREEGQRDDHEHAGVDVGSTHKGDQRGDERRSEHEDAEHAPHGTPAGAPRDDPTLVVLAAHQYLIPIACRTSNSVASATAFAFALPAARTSLR